MSSTRYRYRYNEDTEDGEDEMCPEMVRPTDDELQAREILRLERDKFLQIKDIVLMIGAVILMIGACYILKVNSIAAHRAQCESLEYIKSGETK